MKTHPFPSLTSTRKHIMKPTTEIKDHTEAASILAKEFALLEWNATNVTGGHLATDESGWEHYAWQVNFCPPQKGIIPLLFKCGTGHVTKTRAAWQTPRPIPPKPCEVLACYCRDYRDSDCAFDSWCDEFGYDSDSRKALAIYDGCRAIGPKLQKMGLTRSQIQKFAELSAML